jgi:hypothetical protein
MVHSLSNCPICRRKIDDSSQEKCPNCHWPLNIEDSLNLNIRNSLLEWAICHYQQVDNLRKKDYDQAIIAHRLTAQRDDIDRLQQKIDSFINIPEIKSILSSKEIAINQSIDSLETVEIDSLNSDDSLSVLSNVELNKASQQEDNLISSAPILTKIEEDIISEHYYNISQFADKYQVKTVNVTRKSISDNWGSEKKNVVLEEFNRGNYWIFNLADNIYLVPAKDIDVDPNTYTTTSTIFEGHNYTPDYQKIQLIKPAMVLIDPNTNPQTWRLQQQGELVFL